MSSISNTTNVWLSHMRFNLMIIIYTTAAYVYVQYTYYNDIYVYIYIL